MITIEGKTKKESNTKSDNDNSRKEKSNKSGKEDSYKSNLARGAELGIQGFMEAYQNRTIFSGNWDDNLTTAITLFKSLSTMCRLTEEEMTQSIPIMLKDDAMKFYSENVSENDSYNDVINKLKENYTSEEQKGRMLQIWQSMRLSEFMEQNAELSDLGAFKQFSRKMVKIQKQLNSKY